MLAEPRKSRNTRTQGRLGQALRIGWYISLTQCTAEPSSFCDYRTPSLKRTSSGVRSYTLFLKGRKLSLSHWNIRNSPHNRSRAWRGRPTISWWDVAISLANDATRPIICLLTNISRLSRKGRIHGWVRRCIRYRTRQRESCHFWCRYLFFTLLWLVTNTITQGSCGFSNH